MKPYTRDDNRGRTRGGDDIHHRTADLPRAGARKVAKAARHGARQQAQQRVANELAGRAN